jgi:hypothetical protein
MQPKAAGRFAARRSRTMHSKIEKPTRATRPHLHHLIVQRQKVPENVQVARAKHERIQKLRLERDACEVGE